MSKRKLLSELWNNRHEINSDNIQEKAKAFSRMVPLMIKGEYKPKSKANIIIGLGAVIYAVSPLDLIPDFIPGGFLDDIVIMGYGIKKVNQEIERFLEWEEQQQNEIFVD
ncbi:DUF1232 domain-containing protein [Ornithobacterium rhinotracheale]|nr:DUF1232 domain-containing protein [Ornithobacterium rhinotracheale]MRJ11228.1 DUF1232 domain-containing protein [Ornithobacterium rhinotracheale]